VRSTTGPENVILHFLRLPRHETLSRFQKWISYKRKKVLLLYSPYKVYMCTTWWMYSTHKVEVPSKTQLRIYKRGPEQYCCPGCLSIAGGGPTVVVRVCRKCLAQDGWRVSSSSSLFLSWLNDRTDTTQKQPKNNDVYPKKSSSSLLLPSQVRPPFPLFGPVLPPPSPCVHGGIILTRASLSSYFIFSYFSHSAQRMKSKTTPGNRIRVSWSSFRRMYTLVPVFRRRGYSFSKLSGRGGIRFLHDGIFCPAIEIF
jgi:hypothetical protein